MTRATTTMIASLLLAASASAQPAQPARTVTLPLAEYNRLVDLSSRPTPSPAVAPVGAVLSSADLRVRVDREVARGVFTLAGDVLRAGVNRLTLMSGATLLDGTASGRPLPLATDGGTHAALLNGPGPFTLTLEWGAPVTFTPGRGAFVLPVPQAGTARATIDVPGDQADVHVSAGLLTRRATANGRTTVEITLRPGTATEVWWSMRDSAPVAAAREVRTLADVMTLVTLGDSDVRMVALIDVAVVQGEPRSIEVRLPSGYETTSVSGSTLDSSERRDGSLVLAVSDPAARRHQFLVSLERPHSGGSFSLDTSFVAVPNAQRERGEIAIEGVGTLELAAAERAPLHRIDVRELNTALQSLARLPVLSAFRYQRSPNAAVTLALGVTRFADAAVLAAVANRAVATTLVTAEGRALTEVVLTVQNRAQPFVKVDLPEGATIVSVDVAGQPAKPAVAGDGTRVPLLRSGFRPTGAYNVSFVYLHAGMPFAKKGELQMTLPKMDLPVEMLEWEVFVPENYSVRASDGNVIDRRLLASAAAPAFTRVSSTRVFDGGMGEGAAQAGGSLSMPALGAGLPGQIRGRVTDESGAVLPGVGVVAESGRSRHAAVTDANGAYVLTNLPEGPVTITAHLAGFLVQSQSFSYDREPRQLTVVLRVGALTESVTATGASPAQQKGADAVRPAPPSQNVIELQKKTAGVLPVRVDVPRAGTSHQFVKPVVVDEAATVSLKYKRR